MIVSKNIPILAYIFLGALIWLHDFKYMLSFPAPDGVFDDQEGISSYEYSTTYINRPRIDHPDVVVLVLVTSVASEFKMRQQVRASWANITKADRELVRVEFMMGRPTTSEMEYLKREQEIFNDIIIADITENYYTLSSKSLSMLNYKMRYYPNPKCLVKSDIDNILILRNYVRLCEESVAPLVLGKCDVLRSVQRNSTKWAIPEYLWPYPVYPPYCSGGSYILAGKNVPAILIDEAKRSKYSTSGNFRKLPEDVLITGILPERAGIRRRHLYGHSFLEIPEFICRNSYKHTYSIHLVRDKNPIKYYNKIMKIEGQLCKWWDLFAYKSRN